MFLTSLPPSNGLPFLWIELAVVLSCLSTFEIKFSPTLLTNTPSSLAAFIEEGYRSSNPYHNAVHAVDVAQSMHCYISEPQVRHNPVALPHIVILCFILNSFHLYFIFIVNSGLLSFDWSFQMLQHLTPLEKLIAMFSALAHDVEHPGVNNAFLIATSNHLASLYNVITLTFTRFARSSCVTSRHQATITRSLIIVITNFLLSGLFTLSR